MKTILFIETLNQGMIYFNLLHFFKAMKIQNYFTRNLLLKNNQIKIADYGHSREIEEFDKNLTTGEERGTPLYKSPEMKQNGSNYDLKTDGNNKNIFIRE